MKRKREWESDERDNERRIDCDERMREKKREKEKDRFRQIERDKDKYKQRDKKRQIQIDGQTNSKWQEMKWDAAPKSTQEYLRKTRKTESFKGNKTWQPKVYIL